MTVWPQAYGRYVKDAVGSTLDEGMRMAASHTAPFWVMAHRQTAARGRRGRPWSMPEGNFAATLMLRPEGAPGHVALRSFVMSLALYQAFIAVTGKPELFALKWPNDVLLNGGKVAGILLESAGRGGQADLLALGVGVNLVSAPGRDEVEEGAVLPVSLAAETGVSIGPEDFLLHLAAAYAVLEEQFTHFGFAPVRIAWLAHAARLGEVITARTGQDERTGTFEDVDGDGNLMLRTATGVTRVAAADVFF
ncbi:biotin--[acetyl-CoA-carboxylase] ligase [Roseobacter ponti]|uniref:biotin--[biotin carboxyl-carrier protein] ligase n=1 Tax=Roseobacter ponti TaxID=1891787 RepID=A0A858SSH4_9RHOB|nr:biotin--[acetyl-CoA-carboxylase] ligase [Roseobacter ponti]QJF50868.1 biotin--[acetyl-CoA-carboxylase] ligase [Roseobacter ponti]